MAVEPLLTISGVAMPTPSELSVGVYDISKAERNSAGKMIIERVTTKKKLIISYSFLTATQLSTILKAIEPTYYNVRYLDPVTNSFVTTSMYCGDRTIKMVDFVDNVPRYEGVSFDLIER